MAAPESQLGVSKILQEYAEGNLENYRKLCAVAADLSKFPEGNVLMLIQNLRGCIGLLTQDTKDFVRVILNLSWSNMSDAVLNEYCQFLISLAVGQLSFTEAVLRCIIRNFIPELPRTETRTTEEIEAESGESFRRIYNQAHFCLKSILKIFPMFKEKLKRAVFNSFPYIRRHHLQIRDYVRNLLEVCNYAPDLETEIIRSIVGEAIKIDSICDRENKRLLKFKENPIDTESLMEVDETAALEEAKLSELSAKLDTLLSDIIGYINAKESNKEEKFLNTYRVFLEVFERTVLPMVSSNHVQYLWFFLCSKKQDYCNHFLNWLWNKIQSPLTDSILRQSASCYLAGLLARANFIPLKQCKSYLVLCTSWLQQYSDNQDDIKNPTASKHPLFYSLCQALFYIIVARHKEIIDRDGNCEFLKNLRLDRLVTSKLNPLNFCTEVILTTFANVSRNYQFAFCYGIIERNRRTALYEICDTLTNNLTENKLEWFIPFEPNFLEKTEAFFKPHYRHFELELELDECTTSKIPNFKRQKSINETEDEFLAPDEISMLSRSLEKSAYGKLNFIIPPSLGAMNLSFA